MVFWQILQDLTQFWISCSMPGHQKRCSNNSSCIFSSFSRLSQNVTKCCKETIWPLCSSMVAWITGDALL
uniref:Uncharacterized protein n=1 Tax=Romanomermis culicivorax TaxID=13658 RepID=A0A915K4C9_ROMCU